MQRRIGLTGGIASGKSSVGRLLETRGWPVLDADRYDALVMPVVARYANRAELGRIGASRAVVARYG